MVQKFSIRTIGSFAMYMAAYQIKGTVLLLNLELVVWELGFFFWSSQVSFPRVPHTIWVVVGLFPFLAVVVLLFSSNPFSFFRWDITNSNFP
jgi:glucose dehydrogenase